MAPVVMENCKALAQAAALKPSIRLQQELRAYEAALSNSEAKTLREYQQKGLPDATAVTRLTAQIDRDAGQRHRSWRSKGQRLANILTAVQRIAPVGDVLIGSSQNIIAGSVWAAVRLGLEVGTRFTLNVIPMTGGIIG